MFDYYSQIDDYYNGVLSEAERARFEAQMSEDSDLRSVVENHKAYSAIADGIIDQSISEKIIKAQSLRDNKKSVSKQIMSVIIMGLVIAALLFYINRKQSDIGKEIYAEYYLSPSDTQRGSDNQIDTENSCIKGHAYLEIDKIEKAKSILMDDLEKGSISCKSKSLYLLSLLSIRENDFDTARVYLDQLLGLEENLFIVKGQELLIRISEF